MNTEQQNKTGELVARVRKPYQPNTRTDHNETREDLIRQINEGLDRELSLTADLNSALIALKMLVDVSERIGAPAISQGGLCEEEDWDTAMLASRGVILRLSQSTVANTATN